MDTRNEYIRPYNHGTITDLFISFIQSFPTKSRSLQGHTHMFVYGINRGPPIVLLYCPTTKDHIILPCEISPGRYHL